VTPEQRALGGVIPVLLERPAERLIALLVKGRVDRPGQTAFTRMLSAA